MKLRKLFCLGIISLFLDFAPVMTSAKIYNPQEIYERYSASATDWMISEPCSAMAWGHWLTRSFVFMGIFDECAKNVKVGKTKVIDKVIEVVIDQISKRIADPVNGEEKFLLQPWERLIISSSKNYHELLANIKFMEFFYEQFARKAAEGSCRPFEIDPNFCCKTERKKL